MTSELRVTTLSNATGNGPATLTQQSAAKAHAQIDQNTGHALYNSLNFSSVADTGVGLTDISFTNNFSATSYVNPGSADGGQTTLAVVSTWYNGGNAYRTTSQNSISVRKIADNALNDRTYTVIMYIGDLA